jgi:predicted acetyltransferase
MKHEALGLPRDLGDGLLLRWARPGDRNQIVDFNTSVHADGPDEPATSVGAWVSDLMSGRHPTVDAGDFTVVEDTSTLDDGRPKLVSSLALLSQVWSYDGIEFGVGQPELVGTLPEYRRRGLVRAQMEAVHALSAARGELVQGITGIPWYYRLFGYEMTVNLGGGRLLLWGRPKNKELKPQGTYTERDATVDDVPLLQQLYANGVCHSHLRLLRSDDNWRYMIDGQTPESDAYHPIRIVEDENGQPLGFYIMEPVKKDGYGVYEAGVAGGRSLREFGLHIAQTLWQNNQALADDQKADHITFHLGERHRLYEAMGRDLERLDRLYAWYIRVPDVQAFLMHVQPALEARLAKSVLAGHNGALKLNFIASQLKVRFERGKLVAIEPYEPAHFFDGDVLLPDYTFLHLLFGHRTVDELNHIRKDCYAGNSEAAVLLGCLFPKQSGYIARYV